MFASIRPDAVAFRSHHALSEDQMRRVAPSVFAVDKHDSRSERYTYIPTIDVLRGLKREGFEVFAVQQSRARSADRREFTKHMVKLRHVGDAGRRMNVGDSLGEISLLNSHDGTSSYQMVAGLLRLVCLNGLMVSDSTLASVKVPHKGNVADRVISGAFEVLDGFARVVEAREAMLATPTTHDAQLAFGRAALALRWDDADGPAPITETQVIEPRRAADGANDLWSTFNRTQENLVRGGVRGRSSTGRAMTTREVQGVDSNVRLNRALWVLGDEMRRILGPSATAAATA